MKKEMPYWTQHPAPRRVTRPAAGPDGRPVQKRRPMPRRTYRRRRIPPLRLAVYIGLPALLGVVLLALLVKLPGAAPAPEVSVSSELSSLPVSSATVSLSSESSVDEAEVLEEETRLYLAANPDQNTETLLQLLEHNEDAFSFVVGYREKNGTRLDCTLTADDLDTEENRLLPLFMQWDERWGYTDYSGYLFGTNACGPTTLSMVMVGLTGDTIQNPRVVADFAVQNGYDAGENGSDWTLMSEGSAALGLVAEEIYPMESMVRSALAEGHPVVCIMGPGHFTTGGHYIVICGTEGDRFLINDCNSYTRSAQSWAFEDFADEINCLWEFSCEG